MTNQGVKWQKMYPSNAECKNHDYNKNLMDPPPLPSRIVCSTGDNECNVS